MARYKLKYCLKGLLNLYQPTNDRYETTIHRILVCNIMCHYSDSIKFPFAAQELRAFELVCRQMLMDVQERLVYRTYIYIKSDILQYAAAQGDLAYPEKLEMMEVCSSRKLYRYAFLEIVSAIIIFISSVKVSS